MKKFLFTLLLFASLVCWHTTATAEWVYVDTKTASEIQLVYTATAAANGAFADITVPDFHGFIYQVEVSFGLVAPTSGATDIKLLNSYGIDILADALKNMVTTDSISTPPMNGVAKDIPSSRRLNGASTITISDNAVANAVVTVILYGFVTR